MSAHNAETREAFELDVALILHEYDIESEREWQDRDSDAYVLVRRLQRKGWKIERHSNWRQIQANPALYFDGQGADDA